MYRVRNGRRRRRQSRSRSSSCSWARSRAPRVIPMPRLRPMVPMMSLRRSRSSSLLSPNRPSRQPNPPSLMLPSEVMSLSHTPIISELAPSAAGEFMLMLELRFGPAASSASVSALTPRPLIDPMVPPPPPNPIPPPPILLFLPLSKRITFTIDWVDIHDRPGERQQSARPRNTTDIPAQGYNTVTALRWPRACLMYSITVCSCSGQPASKLRCISITLSALNKHYKDDRNATANVVSLLGIIAHTRPV
ncbi:hypothetical protein BV22DRAFT_183450 [Leucogyrophana mollusca]|uniref:Uncharacterized protein n=1 Tax=Leucogyrophana mollusca TaxID=85980 RepID=A0ACB8BUG2_9AGAM|nr:hypothetical protein BV22DRAFT_183450 [Leucogyrophana mollusca]